MNARHKFFGSPLKPALGGFLTVLLLVAATFSVSHDLHRALHSTGPHLCLVCSLVKGQVTAADVASVPAILTACFFLGWRLAEPPALPGFDYRLSPSRAPPRDARSRRVVD